MARMTKEEADKKKPKKGLSKSKYTKPLTDAQIKAEKNRKSLPPAKKKNNK